MNAKVKEHLLSLGYEVGAEHTNKINGSVWNVYKRTDLPSHKCITNDKEPQINVFRHHFTNGDIDVESYEVELCQENELGWVTMKYYGLSGEDLLKHIDKYEASLVHSWNTSNEGEKT